MTDSTVLPLTSERLRALVEQLETHAKSAQADMRAASPSTRDYWMGQADAYVEAWEMAKRLTALLAEAQQETLPPSLSMRQLAETIVDDIEAQRFNEVRDEEIVRHVEYLLRKRTSSPLEGEREGNQ